MTDQKSPAAGDAKRPAHRAPPRQISIPLSLPVIAIAVGVVSLALVMATVFGFQVSGGQSAAPSLAQSAGSGPQVPQSLTEASGDDDGAPAAAPVPPPGSEAPAPQGNISVQAPANRGMLHVKPVSVSIPRIDVSSTLVDLGLNADNTLQVPQDYSKAGWFKHGTYPGDVGGPPALIVGHVDNSEGPAVFYELDQLKIDDEVLVGRADGSTAVFVVYDGLQFPKDSLPTEELYGDRDGSEIVLITCTGEFNYETGHYLDNYVVRATLDRKRSGLAA